MRAARCLLQTERSCIAREQADEDLLSGIGSSRRPIVVIGAGGKTGKECVRALLRKGGYSVRAAVRGELRREEFETESISADDVDLLSGARPPHLSRATGTFILQVCESCGTRKTATTDACECRGVVYVKTATTDACECRGVVYVPVM